MKKELPEITNKYIRDILIRLLAVAMVISFLAMPFIQQSQQVEGMGGTVTSFNSDKAKSYRIYVTTPHTRNSLFTLTVGEACDLASVLNKYQTNWCWTASGDHFMGNLGYIGFNMGTTVRYDSITAATITANLSDATTDYEAPNSAAWYAVTNMDRATTVRTVNDFKWWPAVKLTDSVDVNAHAAGWTATFTFNAAGMDYLLEHQYDSVGYIQILLLSDDFVTGTEYTEVDTGNHVISFSVDASTKLNITGVIEASYSRTMVNGTNGTSSSSPVTSGTVNTISWYSPRNAFNNENICFDIYADRNYLVLNLELQGEDGEVLVAAIDQTRSTTNAQHYYWTVTIPNNYVGFIRAVETSHGGITSAWGYSSMPIDLSFPTNCIAVNETTYPANNDDLTNYRDDSTNKVFIVYWKTDAGSSDLANAILRLYYLGVNFVTDPANTIFSETLSSYAIRMANNSANNGTLGVGYEIFTMYKESDFDNKSALIINLNKNPSAANWGFYQPVIWDNTSSVELTTTSTCYWWLQSGDEGVQYVLNGVSGTVKPNSILSLDQTIDVSSGVFTNLSSHDVKVFLPDETEYSTYSDIASGQSKQYSLSVGSVSGIWTIRNTLSFAGCSYVYDYDIPLIVQATGSSGSSSGTSEPGSTIPPINDYINSFLEEHGMNNTMGHWGFMLALMIIIALIFVIWSITSKSESSKKIIIVIMAICELVVVGAFIATQFIDLWIVILLALAAGGTIFGIVMKKGNQGGM